MNHDHHLPKSEWESETASNGGGESGGMLAEQVTAAHVAEVVSRATSIPASQLQLAERDKLMSLEAALAQQVCMHACMRLEGPSLSRGASTQGCACAPGERALSVCACAH